MTKQNGHIIRNETLELNIVQHCNLSCRSCSHLSPIIRNTLTDPADLAIDLKHLACVYRADHVRLLGGEPTLHPDLLEIIKVVRESRIAPRIRLVTNGIRLKQMSDDIWAQLDEIHVSFYPNYELDAIVIAELDAKATTFGIDIQWMHFDRFRESYAEKPYTDDQLLRRVYKSCLIAHHWRCYTLESGYFYKCSSAYFLAQHVEGAKAAPEINGVRIDDTPDLYERLRVYLDDPTPLSACSYCLGSVGRLFEHQQVRHKVWRDLQQNGTDMLVDREYLTYLETVDSDADNLCLREHTEDPENADRNWAVL